MKAYVCVDLEMTGFNPKTDRILEIGAVKVIDGEIVEHFKELVNPYRMLSQEIIDLTGITDEIAKSGSPDWDVVQRFLQFAKDLPYVGHHIISDVAFLKQCAMNHKRPLQIMAIDTLKIARRFLPKEQKKSLGELGKYFGITTNQQHRAYDDAVLTFEVMEKLIKSYENEYPDAFIPREITYQVKKQGPLTCAQEKQLKALSQHHQIKLNGELSKMTRNEASRFIDKIILQYGRIPLDGV